MQEAIARAKSHRYGRRFLFATQLITAACSAYSLLPVTESMIGFSCTTGGLNAAAPGASGPVIGMNRLQFRGAFRQRVPILP